VTVDELRRRIRQCREATDRPFGVNFILAGIDDPDATDEERAWTLDRVQMAIDERVQLLVFFWGDASTFIDDAHRRGVKVLVQVGSVTEGRSAAAAGVDAVIAQGLEAGGHVRGTTSIWELLPALVAEVAPVPVLASGGIGDGAGIARALRLGAQAVSLGTRFVASTEAYIHPAYKDRVAHSRAEDTVYTEDLVNVGWPGAPHRVIKNKLFREWDAAGRPPPGQRPGEGTVIGRRRYPWGAGDEWRRYSTGMLVPDFDGDPELAPMWAGESVAVVNDVKPAADIVSDLVSEAERAMDLT
jgi:nitronate monooxygenase/enoyl-[acyl-carrier protein] reductase II